jgi:hypothetical protein
VGRSLDARLLLDVLAALKRRAVALAAWLALFAAPAAAEVVRVGLLEIHAPPGAERSLESLAAKAPAILSEIEADLGVRFRERFVLHLLPPSGELDSLVALLDSGAPPWAAGYLVPARRVGAIRVAQSARYPYGTLESVLAHEATHMLLYDAGVAALPLWFQEGVATWEGRRWSLEDAILYSSSLLVADLPSLAGLDSAFHGDESEAQVAYAASFSFLSREVRRNGPEFLRDLLRRARSRPFDRAWLEVTGSPLADAEGSWRRDSLIRYRWIPVITASSTLWIGITFLALWAGARKRARARLEREGWKEEEEAAAGAHDEPPAGEDLPSPPPPGSAERDADWRS